MKLGRLNLTNFKGIKKFELVADGKDVSVYGTNASGKTTIKDAEYWLLFDKSSDDKKLNPKPIDKDGNGISKVDSIVEGVFILDDGSEIILKKRFYEDWKKKRGSNKQSFTGHKTDFFVDDVPVKKKDYTKAAEMIANVETFKLLSDADYFANKMPWQKRRDLVLEVCGNILDLDIIKENNELEGLEKLLGKHSVDDFRKILKASMKDLNDSIKNIPTRVDEVTLGKSETEGTIEDAREVAGEVATKVKEQQGQIDKINNNEAITAKNNELTDLNLDLKQLVIDGDAAKLDQQNLIAQKIKEHQAVIDEFSPDIVEKGKDLSSLTSQMKENDNTKKSLLGAWHTENDTVFDNDSLVCPTCNKPATAEETKDIKTKWLKNKETRLDKITSDGQDINANNKDLAEKEKKVSAELKILMVKVAPSEKAIESLIDKKVMVDVPDSIKDQITNKKNDIKATEEAIKNIQANSSAELGKHEKAMGDLEVEYEKAMEKVVQFTNNDTADLRTKELGDEEKKLAGKYEELEGQLYLTEQFTRAKVEAVEGRVAKHFKIARFKLFAEQINEGLQEMCEVTMDGIPYNQGLNNAARINIGLDVINTLSNHFEVNVPVFIDNAEGVVDIDGSDSQIIKLIVSGDDKKLRVE